MPIVCKIVDNSDRPDFAYYKSFPSVSIKTSPNFITYHQINRDVRVRNKQCMMQKLCMLVQMLTLARKLCFATFAGVGGWGLVRPPPLGVSKRSVVELRGKDQQIALGDYSRLVVLCLVLGQYMTQLWQVKGQIFANSMIFQLHESMASNLSIVAA